MTRSQARDLRFALDTLEQQLKAVAGRGYSAEEAARLATKLLAGLRAVRIEAEAAIREDER